MYEVDQILGLGSVRFRHAPRHLRHPADAVPELNKPDKATCFSWANDEVDIEF